MPALVAPSLLSANFLNLEHDIAWLNASDADWFHLDVMDGLFVPNISFGFPVIQAIRKATTKPLDVHLMIVEPERYLERFRKAGADLISIHMEACRKPSEALQTIRSLGAKAAVVVNPGTPVEVVTDVLHLADMVLVMSVNPGFGGQAFMPVALEKIAKLREMAAERNPGLLIEVDGGIDLTNAREAVKAGADILVAGNTVFASADPAATIRLLKQAG